MTQILPDLVRPTVWRLHLRLTWGAPIFHEVEGAYCEDALAAVRAKGIQPDRIHKAEFQALDSGEWRPIAQPSLQAAIVLVMRT